MFSSLSLIVVTRESNVQKFAKKMVSISILWQVTSENEIRSESWTAFRLQFTGGKFAIL